MTAADYINNGSQPDLNRICRNFPGLSGFGKGTLGNDVMIKGLMVNGYQGF